MPQLMRKCLLLLCALTLVAAGTISFSAAAASADALCVHEHQTGTHTHQSGGISPHDHHGATCLACCLGACTAIPNLPPRVSVSPVRFAVTPAAYWEAAITLSGRSIAPDLGPPRSQS